MCNIAIIGGGAAGMTAAIVAATAGATVTIFEQKKKVGQKLLSTGNGKCNLSNRRMVMSEYHTSHPRKAEAILNKFGVDDTVDFFGSLGVMIREKNGHLYPYSEQARAVLDAMRVRLAELGVLINTDTPVTSMKRKPDGSYLVMGATFDKVIIASGSQAGAKNEVAAKGYRIASRMGHKIVPVVPGLGRLMCRNQLLDILGGVRCQAKVTLLVSDKKDPQEMEVLLEKGDFSSFEVKGEESGEIQFAANALSGIPVLQLSRIAAYALLAEMDVLVAVDFIPDMSNEEYQEFCHQRLNNAGSNSILGDSGLRKKTLEHFLLGMTHKKINQAIIKKHRLHPDDSIADVGMRQLVPLMMTYKNMVFHIRSVDDWENVQGSAGGVSLAELSDELESLSSPGLYFAGEIIDVDGRCGGYNLQWAWSSGHCAGVSAAGKEIV
jgi:predicted Rossmann fold flavoprotein